MSINFAEEELNTLNYWKKYDIFNKTLKIAENKPKFTFLDGPPFATGLPHYGHILAGTIKDIITRYKSQTGYYVERKFGFDTHGLPVEFEINKKLNIYTKEEILKYGIKNYNNECRKIINKYTHEWKYTIERSGRFVDMENGYKTMDISYMETVWSVFQKLFNKGLVYKGYKVMPYSTSCNTPLSNFEANLDYRDVNDPYIIISFPLVEDNETSLIVFTTTPWTLLSNMALCININLTYIKIKDIKSNKKYIICNTRLCELYPKINKKNYVNTDYELLYTYNNDELIGKYYKPMYNCLTEFENIYRIVEDNYVSDKTGTGIVHLAPSYGEDDYRVCIKNKLIHNTNVPNLVDDNGKFNSDIKFLKNKYIKDADKIICDDIKKMDRMIIKKTINHSYPYCYRSGTPLIYKSVTSWFINVEKIKDDLVNNNKKTYWVPNHVKENRFNNWLENARDWNVSRTRYWGTPLPIWASEDYSEIICIGSIKELEELSGISNINDLHRDFIDDITIQSKTGNILRRIEEVFDCWFESGCAPYKKDTIMTKEPVDFIAEGLDQTRGWYYTLMVLSTALNNKPAFKNVIVNGMVLANDGKKMSKSLKNYPEVNTIFDECGADALRLYLINSPAVKAEPVKFDKDAVHDMNKTISILLYNSLKYLLQNIEKYENTQKYIPNISYQSDNIMDKWLLSELKLLSINIKKDMDLYYLHNIVSYIVKFIKNLNNWYIRMNKDRFKVCEKVAIDTLYTVIYDLSIIISPFMPFLSEYIYQKVKEYYPHTVDNLESVHLLMLPKYDDCINMNKELTKSFELFQNIIESGRIIRFRKEISIKIPLRELILVLESNSILDQLIYYIQKELNIINVIFTNEYKLWNKFNVSPNMNILGKKYGSKIKQLKQQIQLMDNLQIDNYIKNKYITIGDNILIENELLITNEFIGDCDIYDAEITVDNTMVILNYILDDELIEDGFIRKVVSNIQKLRRDMKLIESDEINIYYNTEINNILIKKNIKKFKQLLQMNFDDINNQILLIHSRFIAKKIYNIDNDEITIYLYRK